LAKFRKVWPGRIPRAIKKWPFPQDPAPIRVVRILRSVRASIDVFRTALVSIVLTLTLGQNAALLCRVWCHPQQNANSAACEHQGPTTFASVTANESCAPIAAGPTAFVREDPRGVGSGSDAQQGSVIARFQFPTPSASSARDLERAHATPQPARTLELALRI